jgi:hypothetical protein
MKDQKEWIVILNNSRIDCKGFYCNYPCVTANTKKEASRLLSKAKKYYGLKNPKYYIYQN